MAAVTRIIAILLLLDLVTDIYTHSVNSNSGDVLDGLHPTKDYSLDSDPHKVQKKPSPEKRNPTKSQTRPPRKKSGSKPSLNQPQNSVIKQETDLQTRNTTNISPSLSKGKVQPDKSPVLEIFNGFDSSASKTNKTKPLKGFKDANLGNNDTNLTKVKGNAGGKFDDAYITGLYDHSQKGEDYEEDFSGEDNESEENDDDENPSEHSGDEKHGYDEETDVSNQDYKPKGKPDTHNHNKDKLRDEKGSKHPQRSKSRDNDEDLSEEDDDLLFEQEMLSKQPRGKKRYHWLDRLENDDILSKSVRSRITKLEKYDPKYLDELYRQQSASQRRKFSPLSGGELETTVFKSLKDRPSQYNQNSKHSFRPEVKYKDQFHPNPSSIPLRNRENERQFKIPQSRDRLTPYDENPLQNYKFGADERRPETYSNSYLDPNNIKQDSFGDVYVGFPESELQKVLSSRLASSSSKKPQWPREKPVSQGTDNSFPETKYASYSPSAYDNVYPVRPPGSRTFRVQEAPPPVPKPYPQGGMFNMVGDSRTVQRERYSSYPPENKIVPVNRPNVIVWPPVQEESFPIQGAPRSVPKPYPQGGMFNMFGDTRTVQSDRYSSYPSENKNVPVNRPNVIVWPPAQEESFPLQGAPRSVPKPYPQGATFNTFGDSRTVQSERYNSYPPDSKNVPVNRPNVIVWPPIQEEPYPPPSRSNAIRPGKQNDMSVSDLALDDWTSSVLEKILGQGNNQNVRRGMTGTAWRPTTYKRPVKRSIVPEDDIKVSELSESRIKRRVPYPSPETTIVKRSIGSEDDIKNPELSESRIKRSQSQYRSLRINRSTSKKEVDSQQWRPFPNSVSSSVGKP